MTNKNLERFASLQCKQPSGVAITSGNPYIFGRGTRTIAGVAAESQVATGTANYDTNSGYFTMDIEGAFNLPVKASTQSSPSAGAAINPGDAVYADGGTYDPTSGVTYGITLDNDTNGTFFGIALDAVSAGQTTTIRVMLKNAAC